MKNTLRKLPLYKSFVDSPLYLKARAIVAPSKTVRVQTKIRAALGDRPEVFFVQVGSNDSAQTMEVMTIPSEISF